jgi:hypothetical protein
MTVKVEIWKEAVVTFSCKIFGRRVRKIMKISVMELSISLIQVYDEVPNA